MLQNLKRVIIPVLCLVLLGSCLKDAQVMKDGSIALTFDTVTVIKGNSVQLLSKRYNASLLTWKSSDTTVATVDAAGLVTTKKAGQTTINVAHKSYSVTATCTVTVKEPARTNDYIQIPGTATDVGIGADGSVFIIGTDEVTPTGGYTIYKYNGTNFVKIPGCAGIRIAVSPQGMPWVVNKSNLIFKYNGTTWDQLPGTATDIAIGADGSVFAIGTEPGSATGGYNIMRWTGIKWETMFDCSGIRIAVSPQGVPWVVNKSGIVYRFSGNVLWQALSDEFGNDIGIGADGTVYITTKTTTTTQLPAIYKYTPLGSSSIWSILSDTHGVNIAVSPQGTPWWTTKDNLIFKKK